MTDKKSPPTPNIEQLQHILQSSEQMLECARNGDWVSVQEIERTRKDEIHQFFAHPLPEALHEEVKKVLRVLVDTEIELVELSSLEHNDYKEKLDLFRKNQNAVELYRKNR